MFHEISREGYLLHLLLQRATETDWAPARSLPLIVARPPDGLRTLQNSSFCRIIDLDLANKYLWPTIQHNPVSRFNRIVWR